MQGQKAAVRPRSGSEVQQPRTKVVRVNVQVPQSLKQSNKEKDQSRLPSESVGKLFGLVWDATCIPWCPYANTSVLSYMEGD